MNQNKEEKLLVVITRVNEEFEDYWYGEKDNKIRVEIDGSSKDLIKPIHQKSGTNRVLILSGEEYLFQQPQDEEWMGKKLKEIVVFSCNSIQKSILGIITHNKRSTNTDKFKGSKILFFQRYSSTNEKLCEGDGNNFTAELCKGSLPLDKLRDAVACNKEEHDHDFEEAFKEVWQFFSKESLLEVSILVWKTLSFLKVKIKNGSVDQQQYSRELKPLINKIKNKEKEFENDSDSKLEMKNMKSLLNKFNLENHEKKLNEFWEHHLKNKISEFDVN